MNNLFDAGQRQLVLLLLLAAVLSVLGQVFMKMAVNQLHNAASLSMTELVLRLGGSFYLYLGLALYGIAMLVFFKLLAISSLILVGFSLAVGYVLLVLLAWAMLGETMTLLQWLGAALIVCGVVLINAK